MPIEVPWSPQDFELWGGYACVASAVLWGVIGLYFAVKDYDAYAAGIEGPISRAIWAGVKVIAGVGFGFGFFVPLVFIAVVSGCIFGPVILLIMVTRRLYRGVLVLTKPV